MNNIGELRVGKISAVDYSKGMVRVLYADRDNDVTPYIPVYRCNDEYKMPRVNDNVLVAHLTSGSSRAIVIGTYWNAATPPPEQGKDIYRKEFSHVPGEAYERYDSETKTLHIKAENIIIECEKGVINVADIITD